MQHEAGLRWSGALAIVLALHMTAAWMLLSRGFPPMVMPAAPDAVMLDLAPDLPPVQPAASVPPALAALPPVPLPEPQSHAPPMAETPPEPPIPVEAAPVELPPTPPAAAEATLPVPPPPPRSQPKPKPRPVERQPTPSARWAEAHPTQLDETKRPMAPAPVEAAPAQPSARPPAPASAVTPSWRSDLLARLQRAKRYPDLARSHGDQGAATVSFTMDRGGRVVSVTLVRSSNSALLDDEAVALVRRAEPLPSLPAEMPGSTITLTVPISFALR